MNMHVADKTLYTSNVHLNGRTYRVKWEGAHCLSVDVYITARNLGGYWKSILPDGKIGQAARKYGWNKRIPT